MLCHNVIIFGGPEYILEQANKQCFNWCAATREGDGVVAGGEAAEDPGGDVQDTLTATCTQCFRMSRSQ